MNWTIIIPLIGLLVAVVGTTIALVELCRANKTRRAEFVHRIWSDIVYNKDMIEILYKIDYGGFKYDDSFHNSDDESRVDAVLTTLSYICYLNLKTKALRKADLKCFEYYLTRTLTNRNIQAYLFNLYHFTRKCQATCSYQYLIEYGLRKGLISKTFLSSESPDYPKVLTF